MKVKFLPIEEKHLEIIRNWRNSEEVKKYLIMETYITKEMQKQWYEAIKNKEDEIHWIVEADGNLIGKVDLRKIDKINKTAEWAFYIGEKSARGTGAAVLMEYQLLEYAFCNLKLHKLNCVVLDFNTRVIELHKKFGFVEEGRIRQQIIKEGRFVDMVLLGILDEEWEKSKDRLKIVVERLQHARLGKMTEITKEVISLILSVLEEVIKNDNLPLPERLDTETKIIGKDGILDSLAFVSFLVLVEQRVSEKYGKAVSLTDEKAFAEQRNPFRSVDTLANYIIGQL